MQVDRRRALKGAAALLSAAALPGSLRAQGKPLRIGSTLPLTGPLASLAVIHKVTAEIYVENLNKRGGLLGRPVEWVLRDDQSKPELTRTHLRAAHHRRQGRSHPEPVCHGLDPRRHGRGAALQQGAAAYLVRHPQAREVRHAVPDRGGRLRPRERLAEPHLRRRGEAAQAAEDGRRRHEQVSLGAPHLGRRARSDEEARAAGSAASRVRVRQPRLRPDREPHQGRQSRLPLGRHQRHRPGADAGGDEAHRLPAAGAGASLPGARARCSSCPRRRARSR